MVSQSPMVKCRNCASLDTSIFLDLGTAPPSNAYLSKEDLSRAEPWIPLRVGVCHTCWLVQTEDFVAGPDVFTDDYAYFSSMSETWLAHSRNFVHEAVARFGLDAASFVMEVAANDGYLLRFVQELGIPCLGIEPTQSTARAARELGLTIREAFLTRDSAEIIVREQGQADLVIGNNVFAHVPDIADFAAALHRLTKKNGVVSLEFPAVTRLVDDGLFDTVYHEHFSYLSLTSTVHVLERAGLKVFDVEQLRTHGGSLRVFAQPTESGPHCVTDAVDELLREEKSKGVSTPEYYVDLQRRANEVRQGLLEFLMQQRRLGRRVAAYGAAAKGNTLLNFSGIRNDLIEYVVDRSPGKVGGWLPGSRIPIRPVEFLIQDRPETVLLLPWNLSHEILQQLKPLLWEGVSIYVAVPRISQIH